MPSGLNNNNNASARNNSWLDDLLVKDQTGKLQSWHKAQDVMVTVPDVSPVTNSPTDDIEIAENILPTIYVSPKDDSFYLLSLGGKPQDKAKYAFHPDDERHLQEAALNTSSDDSKKYSLEKIVNKLLEKQALKLDQYNQQIFSDLLYDFFRNRKNSVIVREYLVKIIVNNKPIAPNILDVILSVAKTIKANIEAEGGLVVKADEIEQKNNIKEAFAKLEIKPKPNVDLRLVTVPSLTPSPIKAETPVLKPATEVAKVEPIPEVKADLAMLTPEVKVPPVPIPTPEPVKEINKDTVVINQVSLPKVVRPQNLNTAKTKLHDVVTQNSTPIKAPVKHMLVGPVDELANMNIDNFRRLGPDASSRAQRIYEKIAILEKDSVTKKAAGIAAWRQSPVYQQYLELGASSLMQGQEISNLILKRNQAGEQVLALEEFNTIGDLNKLLRF